MKRIRTLTRRFPSRRTVLALAAAFAALPAARAQSVQVDGDASPFPASNPQPAWDLGLDLLTVGDTGTGSLVITDGGAITNGIDVVLGDGAGSHGTAVVTGSGSSLTAIYNIYVGHQGTGSLLIADGGTVTNGSTETDGDETYNLGDGYIGAFGSGRGEVLVTGAGSSWTSRTNLVVAGYDLGLPMEDASGTLTIAKGGAVNVGETLKIHPTGTVAISVSSPAAALTVGGDLDNDGLVRLSAARGLASGVYNPLAVTGDFVGTGRLKAFGGVWNADARTFTVSDAATAVSGASTNIHLAETQRLNVAGDVGSISVAFDAEDQALGGGSTITFTATENTITEIDGQLVLVAWDFQSDLDATGGGGSFEVTMDFRNSVSLSGVDWEVSRLEVQHSIDGTTWVTTHTFSKTPHLADGFWNSGELTFEASSQGAYAVVLAGSAIPEPSSFAALAGLGVLSLAATRRRRAA